MLIYDGAGKDERDREDEEGEDLEDDDDEEEGDEDSDDDKKGGLVVKGKAITVPKGQSQ